MHYSDLPGLHGVLKLPIASGTRRLFSPGQDFPIEWGFRVNPDELKYTKTHEWVAIEKTSDGKTLAVVGITDFAVQSLADLVFIELPPVGKEVKAGEPLGQVESVKAVSDIYSPVTGRVVDANSHVAEHLEDLTADPFGRGWLAKLEVTDPTSLSGLLDRASYEAQCAAEAEEH